MNRSIRLDLSDIHLMRSVRWTLALVIGAVLGITSAFSHVQAQRTALEALEETFQTPTQKRAVQKPTVQKRTGRPQRAPSSAMGISESRAANHRSVMMRSTTPISREAQWIWYPKHRKNAVPRTACHFRKTFVLKSPVEGEILIGADDKYDLYVNGRALGSGGTAKKLDRYNVTRYLRQGENVLAVRVRNDRGATAALAARVSVRERSGRWRNFSTNQTWKTHLSPFPLWNMPIYSDSAWSKAQVFGPLGRTPPWDGVPSLAGNQAQRNPSPAPVLSPPPSMQDTANQNSTAQQAGENSAAVGSAIVAPQQPAEEDTASEPARFQIHPQFEIQLVLDHDHTGSLIAMTFNEFGHVIASRENGPLLLIYDTNRDHIPDKVKVYCDQVKNCQGILSLNGDVFVTGEGPDGVALYRLSDRDRNGSLETVRALVKFEGETIGEHGPHGISLGPDGLLYVIVGNHSKMLGVYEPSSPHRDYYEGDLVPRYEDPGGHAQGVKAPAGAVIRTSINGGKVELVAGGLRNAYDLAFNREGELFTYDSDMESDEGTTWYRPTCVYHVTAGAEFGWRSGWSKWPDYFADRLPAVLETGRGSPTGIVFYNHHMFPSRYHNALFLADWSEGRILVVRMKRDGAGYRGNSELFLKGQPLNVTDLDVGADGWLYFVTGGRDTEGGLYRVRWKGKVPPSIRNLGDELSSVVRYPQFYSAWTRQAIATLKNRIGTRWSSTVRAVATNKENSIDYRLRALDLMQLFGPHPDPDLLIRLSNDTSEALRVKAAFLLGLHNTSRVRDRLVALLDDNDRTVRRVACESLLRSGRTAPVDAIRKMLVSEDRFEAWAGRRMLERLPTAQWRERILSTKNHRLFVQGSLALLIAHPSRENAQKVLQRMSELMKGFITDRDFTDMLRVAQVAVARGGLQGDDATSFRQQLAAEFPSGSRLMNRELARLLTRLNATSIADRYLAYLQGDAADVDKLHLALHLRFLEIDWSDQQLQQLFRFYDQARKMKGGNSFSHYVANVTRDFAKSLESRQSLVVLAKGDQWPSAALGALYRLPHEIDESSRRMLMELDQRLTARQNVEGDAGQEGEEVRRLQVGIAAVLARGGNEQSMEYLRKVWQADPTRREVVAMGLAQSPFGANWDYLMKSLPILEGTAGQEVLVQLLNSDKRASTPEHYRQVILLGKRIKKSAQPLENGTVQNWQAVQLLEHWTGRRLHQDGDSPEKALEAWTQWYQETFPNSPPATLPKPKAGAKYQYEELLEYLAGEDGRNGSLIEGASVFKKALCAKCHRHGQTGEPMGPDLTSLAKRFTKKETLQSIYYPSHIISKQYATQTIITNKGVSYTGIVAQGGEGEVMVLTTDGRKHVLTEAEIDERVASKSSAMPDGLLDTLTLKEIADLFAYLTTSPQTSVTVRSVPPKKR